MGLQNCENIGFNPHYHQKKKTVEEVEMIKTLINSGLNNSVDGGAIYRIGKQVEKDRFESKIVKFEA